MNGSQSTNDAYPTAIHLGLYASHLKLRPHFIQLIEALEKKSKEFAHVVKMGRTQLQGRCAYDARPDLRWLRFDPPPRDR